MTKRDDLLAEIEATRAAFLALLDRLPPDAWDRPSRNPGWTVGELLFHIAAGVGTTPWNARAATEGRDVQVDWGQIDRTNQTSVQEKAHGATRYGLRELYEAGHAGTLAALEAVPHDAWGRSALLYGGTRWTVEDCFRYVARHFREHAADVEGPATSGI
jgi:uncharacterized protein (TIGR03083 family)